MKLLRPCRTSRSLRGTLIKACTWISYGESIEQVFLDQAELVSADGWSLSKSALGRVNPSWKVALAFLSIFLTVLVWKTGLQESFNRPSVSPTLSLHQKEMAVLAEEGMPSAFRPFLLGEPPRAALLKTLREVSLNELGDRERLLLGALEPTNEVSQKVLLKPVESNSLAAARRALLTSLSEGKTVSFNALNELLAGQDKDPLLRQVLCESVTVDVQINVAGCFCF